MIDKSDINQWLESNFLERRFGCVTDKDIADAFHQCFNDLSDQWVSAETPPKSGRLVQIINEFDDIEVGSYEIRDDGPCWRVGNDCVGWDYDFNRDYTVVRWMPLPEPPK